MLVTHVCYEYGFKGETPEINRKIKCPQCHTVNDVWFEDEEPPILHK
jgi:predicted Zn-ribbon and HTH transcriptional regulator